MRKENLKRYCYECKHRTRLPDRYEQEMPENNYRRILLSTCYGYSKNGLKLNSMDEYKCLMIEDAKNNLKKLDIEQKERRLKVCKTNLEKLTEEITKIEKELEELRNS